MRILTLAGLALIASGIVGLALGHVSYTTHRKVVDVGPISASVAERHRVSIPDIAGFGAIIAGVGLAFAGRRRV